MTSHKVMSDYSNLKESENIKVFIRLRPPANGKTVTPKMFDLPPGNGVLSLRNPNDSGGSGGHKFKFDATFNENATQDMVFKQVAEPLVSKVLSGFNACCFAYGQTGSGKTHSIYGSRSQEGIIPRVIKKLFWTIKTDSTMESSVSMCILEIYCDNIRDLGKAAVRMELDAENDEGGSGGTQQQSTAEWYASKASARKNSSINLGSQLVLEHKIYEDASGRVMIKDAEFIPATDTQAVLDTIQRCFQLRATHKTKMNDVSSRSHTVVIFRVTRTSAVTGEQTCSDLNLIDLAGSERVLKSEATGQRLKEALSINTSLSALGKVILALDPEQKVGGGAAAADGNGGEGGQSSPRGTSKVLSNLDQENYVPYRDSKLTRILQNSLGGNSFTTVLATVHPLGEHYEECLSTLLFAAHCRRVSNAPVVNRKLDVALLNKTMLRLRKQIKQLNYKVTVLKTLLRTQTADIMAQLGIKGDVLPDGRFRLEDGRIVGTSASAIEAALGDGEEDAEAAAARLAALAAASSQLAAASGAGHSAGAAMEATRRALHDQRSQFQKKLDKSKDKLATAEQHLDAERRLARETQNGYIHKIDELSATITQQSQALREQQAIFETKLADAQKSHEDNIREFVSNRLSLQATQRSSATSMAAAAAAASGGRRQRNGSGTSRNSSLGGESKFTAGSGAGRVAQDLYDDEEEDDDPEFLADAGGETFGGDEASTAPGGLGASRLSSLTSSGGGAADAGGGSVLASGVGAGDVRSLRGRGGATGTEGLSAPRLGGRTVGGHGLGQRARISITSRRGGGGGGGGGDKRRGRHRRRNSNGNGGGAGGADPVVEHMKQQFEHWMHKRSHEVATFVAQLNGFYAHKKRQVAEYRAELSQVYAHCNRLTHIVVGFQQGRYGPADFRGLHPVAARDINAAAEAFDELKRLKHLQAQVRILERDDAHHGHGLGGNTPGAESNPQSARLASAGGGGGGLGELPRRARKERAASATARTGPVAQMQTIQRLRAGSDV